jgi:hypothetical protein
MSQVSEIDSKSRIIYLIINSFSKMKKDNYYILTAVLLCNIPLLWSLLSIGGILFLFCLFVFTFFNLCVFLAYKFANRKQKPVLQEISFYVSLYAHNSIALPAILFNRNRYEEKMKKYSLSNYCKLAAVLFCNVIPVWFLISNSLAADSRFSLIGFLCVMIFLLIFNLWVLLVHELTKWIQKPVLREVLFYVLLFLFMYSPDIIGLLMKLFK